MEGEGGLEGGLSGGDKAQNNTKFLPTNAWAWKAVGAYDMVSLECKGYQCCLTLLSTDQ
jgi:superkiller protein 3